MSQKDFQPTPEQLAALAALDARRSVPPKQLGEPGPDDAMLLRMLQWKSVV